MYSAYVYMHSRALEFIHRFTALSVLQANQYKKLDQVILFTWQIFAIDRVLHYL